MTKEPLKHSESFLMQSKAWLCKLFQQQSKEKEVLPKDRIETTELSLNLLRKLAKDDDSLQKKYFLAKDKAIQLAKDGIDRGSEPRKRVDKPRDDTSSDGTWTVRTFTPPYDWPFHWSTASRGNETLPTVEATAGAKTGDMAIAVRNFSDEDYSCDATVAVGSFFQPNQSNATMHISSQPSISYFYEVFAPVAHGHAHAFMGIYVGEHSVATGKFEGAVVDQKINLWDLDLSDRFSGGIDVFSLTASTPVDNEHFYEVWVWAGGDTEVGSFEFPWVESNLKFHVPSISIFVQ